MSKVARVLTHRGKASGVLLESGEVIETMARRVNHAYPLYDLDYRQNLKVLTEYLKAIEINGRIGVLYSNKDYGCEWDYDFRNKRFMVNDNTRFAVNIVMYAMTA